MKIIPTLDMSREEWLEARKVGIGGSDIATILGANKWSTPYQVWQSKTGRDEPDEENERMYWGTVLEDVVAREYARRTGSMIQRMNAMVVSGIQIANVDRLVVPGCGVAWTQRDGITRAEKILECKTAGSQMAEYWGMPGTDEIPESYAAQVMWYMDVTGVHEADVAVLIGGSDFRIYTLAYDAGLAKSMRVQAENWWRKYVLTDTPPPAQTPQEAAQKWPRHRLSAAYADETVYDAVNKLIEIREQKKEVEQQEKTIQAQIQEYIGEHEALIDLSGNPLITWKSAKDSTKTDWQAVAAMLNPSEKLIKEHTKTMPGSRRFLVK